MKAVVFKEHGSVDKLVYDDFGEPEGISLPQKLISLNHCLFPAWPLEKSR